MPSDDETAAIRRSQGGDATAFETVITRYYAPMVRLAYLLTGDHDLAEDLAQEGFWAAYRNLHQFRVGQPFQPWISRIVVNLVRQHQRQRATHSEVSLSRLEETQGDARMVATTGDPALHAQHTETRATIIAALGHLTPRQREAVVLRYYGGLSDQELAAALDCRAEAARQRVRSGLLALEAVIRQHYPWLIADMNDSLILPSTPKEVTRHDATI